MAIDAKQFEMISGKIEKLKATRAKAEGAIEAETASWKRLFKVETREEMEAKLKESEDELEGVETKMSTYMDELKGLTNWALL